MSSAPVVTVIIPTYNYGRFLKESITSVLSQEAAPIEVLVIDDGSTDNTPAILATFGDRIRVIQQDHLGGATALNRGVREAEGDLIAFLDSDDVWLPGKLGFQIQYLKDHPECDICFGQLLYMMEPGQQLPSCYRPTDLDGPLDGTFPSLSLLRGGVAQKVGGFDEKMTIAYDFDFFARASDQGFVFGRPQKVLIHKRIHAANISSNQPASKKEVFAALRSSTLRKRGGKIE